MTTITNPLPLGQHLGEALARARTLIDGTPEDLATITERLRGWYSQQPPAERDRLLWQDFTKAEGIHRALVGAVLDVQAALAQERDALARARAEREALAAQPVAATVAQEAEANQENAVRRYRLLTTECAQRDTAISDLERLLGIPGDGIVARTAEACWRRSSPWNARRSPFDSVLN